MSIIEEGHDDNDGTSEGRRRPWWFFPGLAAVVIGALAGSLVAAPVSPTSPVASQAPALWPSPYSGPGTSTCPSCTVVTPPLPTPQRSGTFPPVLGPARVFVFDETKSFPASYYTEFSLVPHSRYVLYDDGSFVLQYAVQPPIETLGTYKEASGVIKFEWSDSWSLAGPFEATGQLEGNSLRVLYSFAMKASDSYFWDDAGYIRR